MSLRETLEEFERIVRGIEEQIEQFTAEQTEQEKLMTDTDTNTNADHSFDHNAAGLLNEWQDALNLQTALDETADTLEHFVARICLGEPTESIIDALVRILASVILESEDPASLYEEVGEQLADEIEATHAQSQ
jgi:uncharacterized protein Yka (UPF0111/DUF47 family)